jgi:hypothetical protein
MVGVSRPANDHLASGLRCYHYYPLASSPHTGDNGKHIMYGQGERKSVWIGIRWNCYSNAGEDALYLQRLDYVAVKLRIRRRLREGIGTGGKEKEEATSK